jgi:2,4-dienoyl-CoA reductase-like NADH-dependent reductase (Old Yellow Enzyme family)
MKLFEPIKIGQMDLKNRIIMPAIGTGYGNEMGFSTERLKEYLQERARGGQPYSSLSAHASIAKGADVSGGSFASIAINLSLGCRS